MKQNDLNKSSLKQYEDVIEALKNKEFGQTVFDVLQNIFLEEKENTKLKYENLVDQIEKIKIYFDEKVDALKNNTHENLVEIKYYLDQLNKNNKENAAENNTLKDDFCALQDDILKLKKQKEENINIMKTSMRTYFDKIKNMLNVMNTNVESIQKELITYKENNTIENKKKNIEILQIINDENEKLNKRLEESFNSLNKDIREINEYISCFKDSVTNSVKDIEQKIEINIKEIDKKFHTISINQKQLLDDFYTSEKS
ncbi:conserved protein, unknown function [Hepatocystis sp. ex Piliocolobus tephrosceles]|nr:conserved protein, unknown function [Hepatocystis sp. ex Piliocolobus tephrosceles]